MENTNNTETTTTLTYYQKYADYQTNYYAMHKNDRIHCETCDAYLSPYGWARHNKSKRHLFILANPDKKLKPRCLIANKRITLIEK